MGGCQARAVVSSGGNRYIGIGWQIPIVLFWILHLSTLNCSRSIFHCNADITTSNRPKFSSVLLYASEKSKCCVVPRSQ